MLGDLGQLEVIGAIIGGAIAAGVPAFSTARRTNHAVRTSHSENKSDSATIFRQLGDLLHSIETLRDQVHDHDAAMRADNASIREESEKADVEIIARLERLERHLTRPENDDD